MKYNDFLKAMGTKDYILIRMTDSFPFFKEKVFVRNGRETIDRSYHIANGTFSTYINYEMPDNGISAEVSWNPRFEITGKYDCPVYVTNIGEYTFDIELDHRMDLKKPTGSLAPGEVLAIYPEYLARETSEFFWEEQSFGKTERLTQDEINRLLNGGIVDEEDEDEE